MTAVITEALRRKRTVLIEYLGERDPQGGRTREIEPYCRLVSGRSEYLLAWCRARRTVRAFRIDRIRTAHLGRNAPRNALEDLPEAERRLPLRCAPFTMSGSDLPRGI